MIQLPIVFLCQGVQNTELRDKVEDLEDYKIERTRVYRSAAVSVRLQFLPLIDIVSSRNIGGNPFSAKSGKQFSEWTRLTNNSSTN